MSTNTDPKGVEITEGTYPLDSNISTRNRSGRLIVLAIFALGIPLSGALLGLTLANMIFDAALAGWIGFILGLGAGAFAIAALLERLFIIRNNTTSVFLTIDQLQTLLGTEKAFVLYGAGTHISFPWEQRLPENIVSLEEVSDEFDFEVQCKDGVLRGQGSYRFRATPERIVPFLLGVASVAGEISDLIERTAAEFFEHQTVLVAVRMYKELNDHLQERLVEGLSDIERRFGIDMTDVTAKKLLPTKELQRAITAIAEADAVQKGVIIMLNCTSKRQLDNKLKSGLLTQSDVNLARDRFLSMSGNLEGVNITRNEVDVKIEGLDADAMKALTDLARSPAAIAAAAHAGKSGKSKPKGGEK